MSSHHLTDFEGYEDEGIYQYIRYSEGSWHNTDDPEELLQGLHGELVMRSESHKKKLLISQFVLTFQGGWDILRGFLSTKKPSIKKFFHDLHQK